MSKKGCFITFEGIDGCGKTTQMELLKKYLKVEKKLTVLQTREPGGKGLGQEIRKLLLNYDGEVSPKCESFLFLADRAQNIDIIVTPAIERGEIVLCDRHTDSTTAYQGYGRGVDIENLTKLNDLATGGRKPDLTIVFDIDVETSMKRVGKTRDRMEESGEKFFESVRNGYLQIAKSEPKRVKVIDATQTIDEIHKQVVALFEELYAGG